MNRFMPVPYYLEMNRFMPVPYYRAEEVLSPGKQPRRVEARSVACFWAVRALGMTTVEVSRRLGITQSAVTKAVYRGEKLAKDRGFQMISAAK
jgi:hypothetical protein